jgi:hypothetical protein
MSAMKRQFLNSRGSAFPLLILIGGTVVISASVDQAHAFTNKPNHGNVSSQEITKTLIDKGEGLPDNTISKTNVNGQVSGSGAGQFACSGGKRVDNTDISFVGFKTRVPLYGSWEIAVTDNGNSKSLSKGAFQGGTIAADHYSLSGREIANKICENAINNIGTLASVSGECGQGVAINLSTKSGEKGSFNGDVVCSIK